MGVFWDGVGDEASVYTVIVAMPSAQNISVRSVQNKHTGKVLPEWYRTNVIMTLLIKLNTLVFNVSLFPFICSCLVADAG